MTHSVAGSNFSATAHRNVGVLEVKMKKKLEQEKGALAVGFAPLPPSKLSAAKESILPSIQPSGSNNSGEHRPITFGKEREVVMENLNLPSPTRYLIQRQVKLTKLEREKEIASLPPLAGAFKKRGAPHSLFPRAYQRGEIPIMIESKAGGKTIRWTQDMKQLDFSKYFPLFIEGVRERTYPYAFLAREGAFQLLQFGAENPERVIDCLNRIVPALRSCLDTRESKYIRDTLMIIQTITSIEGVGPRLVPYYRQILPVLNMFKNKRRNLGDQMDYSQQKSKDLSEMILETLEILERTGGMDAFVNIKYMVPTYEGISNKKR